jgi:hypothetical protein
MLMFTFKNLAALGLFLFGSTFLWMTASFAGRVPPPSGFAWSLDNVLAFVAVVGFGAAAWGVLKDQSWWEVTAVASAIVGLVAVVPYLVGLAQIDVGLADPGVQINLAMHVLGSATVIAIVSVPTLHQWLSSRLT